MSSEINLQRRRFFGVAAMTMAAVEFGLTSAAGAQSQVTAPAVDGRLAYVLCTAEADQGWRT